MQQRRTSDELRIQRFSSVGVGQRNLTRAKRYKIPIKLIDRAPTRPKSFFVSQQFLIKLRDMNGKIYQFEDYLLDLGEQRLQKNGEEISLPPRVFDVLSVLVKKFLRTRWI